MPLPGNGKVVRDNKSFSSRNPSRPITTPSFSSNRNGFIPSKITKPPANNSVKSRVGPQSSPSGAAASSTTTTNKAPPGINIKGNICPGIDTEAELLSAKVDILKGWQAKLLQLSRFTRTLEEHLLAVNDGYNVLVDGAESLVECCEERRGTLRARHAEELSVVNAEIQRLQSSTDECNEEQHREETLASEVSVMTDDVREEALRVSHAIREGQEELSGLEKPLEEQRERTAAALTELQKEEAQASLMRSGTYGLDNRTAQLVQRDEELRERMEALRLRAIQTEIERRQLASLYEELKGTIRVYCRVRSGEVSLSPDIADKQTKSSLGILSFLSRSPGKGVNNTVSAAPRCVVSFPDLEKPEVGAKHPRSGDCDGDEVDAGERKRASGAHPRRQQLYLNLARDNATSTGKITKRHEYIFDRVFSQNSRQSEVFDDIGALVDNSVDGYNVCILAYGATSSGKTYTMEGVMTEASEVEVDGRSTTLTQSEVDIRTQSSNSSALDFEWASTLKSSADAHIGTDSALTASTEVRYPKSHMITEGMGVIPRAVVRVFQRIDALKEDGWSYTVTCSVVEIYNDIIRNLLDPREAYHRAFLEFTEGNVPGVCAAGSGGGGGSGLALGGPGGAASGLGNINPARHHTIVLGSSHTVDGGPVITNLEAVKVVRPADVYKLLRTAVKNRAVAKTNLNERSSRSHSVFTLTIEGWNSKINQRSVGNLCLIDLAGSERISKSGVEGQQLREAVSINTSLTSLSRCIGALQQHSGLLNGTDAPQGFHVIPWRESKLTMLLQKYLGGEGANSGSNAKMVKGSKILFIVTVSDQEKDAMETHSTLQFAEKVSQTHIRARQ